MSRNDIIFPRICYIIISAIMVAAFIIHNESGRRAVIPAVLYAEEEDTDAYVHEIEQPDDYTLLKQLYSAIV